MVDVDVDVLDDVVVLVVDDVDVDVLDDVVVLVVVDVDVDVLDDVVVLVVVDVDVVVSVVAVVIVVAVVWDVAENIETFCLLHWLSKIFADLSSLTLFSSVPKAQDQKIIFYECFVSQW